MTAFQPAWLGDFFHAAHTGSRMTFSRRRLPHWQPSGQPLFLTWHLYGSLPRNRFPPPSSGSAGKAFVWMDRFLDEARSGPTWLQREEIARLVLRSIQYAGDSLQFYHLHAWVIMSNHVHLLVAPRVAPTRFLQSVKGYTAREANRLLRRTGEPFWQGETNPTTAGSEINRNSNEYASISSTTRCAPVSQLARKSTDDRVRTPARMPAWRAESPLHLIALAL